MMEEYVLAQMLSSVFYFLDIVCSPPMLCRLHSKTLMFVDMNRGLLPSSLTVSFFKYKLLEFHGLLVLLFDNM